MITVTVCLGSYCHVKGSKAIIDIFRYKIKENELSDKVEIAGRFCTGNCAQSVCVEIGNELYTVKPENAGEFFDKTVIPLTEAAG